MTDTPVSVIIVSRGRPQALACCLTGVSQLLYARFEIIVVADPAGLEAVEESPFASAIKCVSCDEPNISSARNLGLAEAAGEIVAFIDDDAVPEPTWLNRLVQAFEDDEVVAASGYVRARNGISFQNKASSVDVTARTVPLALDESRPNILHPKPGRAIKTEGTNMAFRAGTLRDLGGFDPAFRFFLDETDLNMRLAQQGLATAIVPLAEVHHGFHASPQRFTNRAPRDLTEIGASLAVFLRKHCPEARHERVLAEFEKEQRRRVLEHIQSGTLEPRDLRRMMSGLRKGFEDGRRRPLHSLQPIPKPSHGFQEFVSEISECSVILSGRSWQAASLRKSAQAALARNRVVSVFRFSPTALYHRVRFHPDGYWLQTGGLFGRADRAEPGFRLTSFGRRLSREIRRVGLQRGLRPPLSRS